MGATTTYTYARHQLGERYGTNGRWTETTQDGLGRPIKVELGDADGTKSTVDTEYGPCSCSPLSWVQGAVLEGLAERASGLLGAEAFVAEPEPF